MKIPKRCIDGIILLDKPKGISSNHALQKIKRLFQAKKAGHTGSLDPLATGMLPICFGNATKFSQYLLDATKIYEVNGGFGVRTDTADAEGAVISSRQVPNLDMNTINEALNHFRGNILQVPPMYSALKHQGQPLYQLARAGKNIERPPRAVSIYQLDLLEHQSDFISLRVVCSKGTYIRSLVDDLGELLGCGAHVVELRRTGVSTFVSEQLVNFSMIETLIDPSYQALDQLLLPIESVFNMYPEIEVTQDMIIPLRNKMIMDAPDHLAMGYVRFMMANKEFLGLGKIAEDKKLYPLRLLHHLL